MATPITSASEAIALAEHTAQSLEDLQVPGLARNDTLNAINSLRRLAAIVSERQANV